MDFFDAQDRARRQSLLLVGLFAGAVVSIIVAVYLVVLVGGGYALGTGVGFDPAIFAVVALGTGGLIGAGSAFRTAQLSKGGPAVAELLGGRSVPADTRDPAERRLVNVVEEMAVASGVPVPAIYVLDREDGINAFAAGYSIHDAAVAVTRGTLETLDRDELQGVMAHEFSHILNGDMRLNIRLVGLLFGILLLAVVGRGLLRGQMLRGRRGGANQAALLGIALVTLGYIGVFFGKLIKAAVSRQREYLADAAAVQFTRNPAGIAGALRKIADGAGSRVRDHHGEELSHLFFADGVGGAFAGFMATHPPIEERIRRIDPALATSPAGDREAQRRAATGDGTSDLAASLAGASVGPTRGTGTAPRQSGGTAGLARGRSGGPDGVLRAVGAPDAENLALARRLLQRIPAPVREAVHDPVGAQAVILGLLGADTASVAEARTKGEADGTTRGERGAPALAIDLPDEIGRWSAELEPLLSGLAPDLRLPLVDLALPTLASLPQEDVLPFRRAVEARLGGGGGIRTFDFALIHILWRHLAGGNGRRSEASTGNLERLRRELELVLSALARAGAGEGEEGAVMAAFQAGMDALEPAPSGLTLRSAGAAGFPQLDEALGRLERAPLAVRRQVLRACAAVVLADDRVDLAEVELLRAVAESLELPLPPLSVRSGIP
jgi:Zn-dependent protease with chaperone function